MLFCGLVSAGLGGLEKLACALNGWSRIADASHLATVFDLAVIIPSIAVSVSGFSEPETARNLLLAQRP